MKKTLACLGTALCLAAAFAGFAQASPAPRPAYYLADFALTNPEAIKPYSAQVEATFRPYSGRYIVRGGTQTVLEGKATGGRLVIIAFDSAEQARAWYASPAYAKLKPIRHAAGKSHVLLVDGLPQAMPAHAGTPNIQTGGQTMHHSDTLQAVAPALQHYAQENLLGDIWKRPDLSPRDRSVVTLAALIARHQTAEIPAQLEQALKNGVKPAEISEIVTHLAFYSGWGNAVAAASLIAPVFAARGISAAQLPQADDKMLPLNEAAEAARATQVAANFGAVAPGVVKYTEEVLFRDLWLRPALAPRDRSLVTVSALIASGQVAQIPYHLNRAMDNGLTQAQASEALTQLAFYAGWPMVFSALPVVKEVFEKRPG